MIRVLLSRIAPTLTETTNRGSLNTAKKAWKIRNLNYKNDHRRILNPRSNQNFVIKILNSLARPRRAEPKDRNRPHNQWAISHWINWIASQNRFKQLEDQVIPTIINWNWFLWFLSHFHTISFNEQKSFTLFRFFHKVSEIKPWLDRSRREPRTH